jgi:tRNA(Ser,Leu) C12 N-acetylase TAN1
MCQVRLTLDIFVVSVISATTLSDDTVNIHCNLKCGINVPFDDPDVSVWIEISESVARKL